MSTSVFLIYKDTVCTKNLGLNLLILPPTSRWYREVWRPEKKSRNKKTPNKQKKTQRKKDLLELELGNLTEAKFGAIEKNTAQIRYWAYLRLSDYIMLISNWVFKMKNNQVPEDFGHSMSSFSNMQGNLKLASRYIHSFYPSTKHTNSTIFLQDWDHSGYKVEEWVEFYVRTTDNLWLPNISYLI